MNTHSRFRFPTVLAAAEAAVPVAGQMGDRADLDRSDPPPSWQIRAALSGLRDREIARHAAARP